MTPRELLRLINEEGCVELVLYGLRSKQEHQDAIALTKRALSLAAAVDEAGDEVVRELDGLLSGVPCQPITVPDHPWGQAAIALGNKAAALLVSQREEIKRKDAEIAGLKEERDEWKRSFNLQILSEPRAAHPKE